MPHPRRGLTAAFIICAALCCAVCWRGARSAQAEEASDVRIGYLLDLSAKGAFMGVQSRAGAALAARKLSEVGIRVVLTFEDHRTEGSRGASLAQKLFSVDQVDGLLCDLTPPCVAAATIAKRNQSLFFYQAPADSVRTQNPFSFQNFLDYSGGCEAVAKQWRSEGVRDVAHFKVNAEFGELCAQGMARLYPQQFLIEYDAGSDLRGLVLTLTKRPVERILQTGYEGDYIQRLRAMHELHLIARSGLPQPLLTPMVINSVPPSVLDGTIVFGFPRIADSFREELRQAGLYQSEVSIESAAIAYQHVYQLARAIKSCGKGALACQQSHVAQSKEGGEALGFQGWLDRKARYPIVLRRWNGSGLEDIDLEAFF